MNESDAFKVNPESELCDRTRGKQKHINSLLASNGKLTTQELAKWKQTPNLFLFRACRTESETTYRTSVLPLRLSKQLQTNIYRANFTQQVVTVG